MTAAFVLTTLVIVIVIVFAAYGPLAAAMRDRVLRRPKVMDWMRRVFAGTFAALGARLALETR